MIPKEITVNYGKTINTGNYESLRLDYSIRCQLNEDERKDVGRAIRIAHTSLKNMLEDAVKTELDDKDNVKPPRRRG